MYGIFTYICHKNEPNAGKYTIHGSYGYWYTFMYTYMSAPSTFLVHPSLLWLHPHTKGPIWTYYCCHRKGVWPRECQLYHSSFKWFSKTLKSMNLCFLRPILEHFWNWSWTTHNKSTSEGVILAPRKPNISLWKSVLRSWHVRTGRANGWAQ